LPSLLCEPDTTVKQERYFKPPVILRDETKELSEFFPTVIKGTVES